jgi:hypothetical protein
MCQTRKGASPYSESCPVILEGYLDSVHRHIIKNKNINQCWEKQDVILPIFG